MKLLRQEAMQFLLVAGFFTSVGIAQAVLFRGKAPRLASWLAGGSYFSLVLIWFAISNDIPAQSVVTCGVLFVFFLGCACGYVAGVSIAGVFLIADYLRKWLGARPSSQEVPEESIFDRNEE
jgi:hypothetical protein